jgi:pilus assembly protein Flp/PilA
VAARRLVKPSNFLTFDQAFDRTMRMTEPRGENTMLIFFTRLIKDESGVTAIEYGLITALIVVGSLIAVNSVSLNLNLANTFSKVAANL